MSVQTSIVIDFGASGENKFLFAELDNEKNGSKTTFRQGDDVYFKIYADCAYSVRVTAGSALLEETIETDIINETASFINNNQFTVTKKIKTGTLASSPTWYGTNLGNIQKIDNTIISLVTETTDLLGVCKIEYKSEYDLWKLSSPVNIPDEYAIIILITCD